MAVDNFNFYTFTGSYSEQEKQLMPLLRLFRETIISTTSKGVLDRLQNIAYKEIAESLCSRHNVVT